MLHAKFQNHRPSGSEEEDFLKIFAIYSHGSHLGHVTLTIYTNFHCTFLTILLIKFGFDWPSSFREDFFFFFFFFFIQFYVPFKLFHSYRDESIGRWGENQSTWGKTMYIAPGWGQTDPWGPKFFRIINLKSICPFPASFPTNNILTLFPIQMHE